MEGGSVETAGAFFDLGIVTVVGADLGYLSLRTELSAERFLPAAVQHSSR